VNVVARRSQLELYKNAQVKFKHRDSAVRKTYMSNEVKKTKVAGERSQPEAASVSPARRVQKARVARDHGSCRNADGRSIRRQIPAISQGVSPPPMAERAV